MMLLAVACARVPSTELAAAEHALNAARNADAAIYAPAEWQEAQDAMAAAKEEIAAQELRLAPMRSYGKAIEMLAMTGSLAGTAESVGIAGRDKARQEAEAAIDQVRADLEVATGLLGELEGCRHKPKDFTQELELFKGYLQSLNESLPEIEDAIDGGHLRETKRMAGSLQSEVTTFVADLNTTKTRFKC
jgi:chromosome segregation ATPase